MRLILSYTVQLVIPNVCTKFQNPKSSSFREIFDRKKVNKHARTHTNRKGKNYIPPIYFVCRGYNYHFYSREILQYIARTCLRNPALKTKNGKLLKLQIEIIQREHMANQMSSHFPKGGHSATYIELKIICKYIRPCMNSLAGHTYNCR